MQFKNPLLVVRDMHNSKMFYKRVLNLDVELDFGANVTLCGGVSLQTRDSWETFVGVGTQNVLFGGNAGELYFEEDNFDAFIEKLEGIKDIDFVHPVFTHPWGQRVVRFYDPDKHMIEVGENIKMVCRRFVQRGLTPQQTAMKMDVPLDFVLESMK